MAAATVTGAGVDPDCPPPLRLDSIPTIDLRLLSQSELYSLSLSSNSCFDLNHQNGVVLPKINRSVFNESAGSRKQTYSRLRLAPPSTVHRRTPHLRASHAPPSNHISDPQQAENSHVIRMLKRLCKSNPNFQDLVSLQVENDTQYENPNQNQNQNQNQHQHQNQIQNDVVLPELLVPEIKRKRGRPRKHENAVFVNKRLCNNRVRKGVVFDGELDRGIVNCNGLSVNLEGLGAIEDPFGDEIRRRTHGMRSEEDLLGFLSGLNGDWGSRRRKKRLVDASEFGDVLPKGWKISLCIKKKEGRVWLFCRRYISPSGRQFESCKDVSTYLLSIVGEENLDKPSHTHSNKFDHSASKGASGTGADLIVQEDIKTKSPVRNPSSPSTSLPTGTENCVNSDIGNPVDVQVRQLFKCLKCFLIFDGKDDLLDHQVLVHKTERSQLDSAISDLILVKDGIFECPLCHMTFGERNEHNEHIGTHTKNEIMTPEASHALTSGKDVYPKSDYKISSVTESKTDEHVHDLNVLAHANQGGDDLVEECADKTIKNSIIDEGVSAFKSDFYFGHEASMSINESHGNMETSCETADRVDDKPEQNRPFSNKSAVGVLNQEAVCETLVRPEPPGGCVEVLNHSNLCEEKDYPAKMDDELTSEKAKVVNSESSSGVFHNRVGFVDDSPIEIKKLSDSESHIISSKKQESPQKVGFSASVDQITRGVDVNRLSYAVSSSELDGQCEDRSSVLWREEECANENVQSKVPIFTMEEPTAQMNMKNFHMENDSSNKLEPSLDDFQMFRNNESITNASIASLGNPGVMGFTSGKNLEFSLVPPRNDQEFGFQDDVTDLYDECKNESSERGLLNHFCISETSDDIFGNKIYSTSLDGLKFDEDRDIGMHELSLAFGNNPHSLYADPINVEPKKDEVSCSSKIDNAFDVQTDLSMVNNSMMEDLKSGRGSMGGLFSLSGNNNGDTGYPGRAWTGLGSGGFRNSEEKKFMIGSGSNQGQRNEVGPCGIWKTREGNQVQSGLANPTHAQTQSPPGFHSFDIMSNKAGDGLFRLNERYNDGSGVGGLRSGQTEPMEFSFLTGRSEHNPRAFSYNTAIDQAFDSSFWAGKHSMNVRNIVTSVCAWCRNEFHLHPETQSGIGSLCPACSAGISGQVNML